MIAIAGVDWGKAEGQKSSSILNPIYHRPDMGTCLLCFCFACGGVFFTSEDLVAIIHRCREGLALSLAWRSTAAAALVQTPTLHASRLNLHERDRIPQTALPR